jgi:hypothetical protein
MHGELADMYTAVYDMYMATQKVKRTSKQIAAHWNTEAQWALKNAKRYTDITKMFADLRK